MTTRSYLAARAYGAYYTSLVSLFMAGRTQRGEHIATIAHCERPRLNVNARKLPILGSSRITRYSNGPAARAGHFAPVQSRHSQPSNSSLISCAHLLRKSA